MPARVLGSAEEEAAWIRPRVPHPVDPWDQPQALIAAHGVVMAAAFYPHLRAAFLESAGSRLPVEADRYRALELKLEGIRKEFRARMDQIQRREDFLFQLAGVPIVTPEQIDTLADEAFETMRREGAYDPITFAQRKRIDLRVADLAFRRLIQQERIEEADTGKPDGA